MWGACTPTCISHRGGRPRALEPLPTRICQGVLGVHCTKSCPKASKQASNSQLPTLQ